jgi:phosphoglucomutase
MSVPIHFGTSGWRAVIADEFTFDSVRLVTAAIAEHARSQNKISTLIVAHDTRFFSEEFARTAAEVLRAHGVQVLLCEAAAPTPAIAYEILRRRTDGAINFTASHNPAEYHGLKFSGPDGGPALPEVTRDIEGRVARLAARPAKGAAEMTADRQRDDFQKIDPRCPYLARLGELVNFDAIRQAQLKIVCDPIHGCGAGYLDRVLADQGLAVMAIRTERDVLFDGSGPDVSEQNLAPLRHAVVERGAQVGLATDGDADRFGISDADGNWMSPNHILALLYDYLIESRGWRMPAARSVATTKLLDRVARHHGTTVYQTPVGFKYIGELIKQDKIALGGEESAGLSIRGHVPEKDGILAALLVAEMVAVRRKPLGEQLRTLFQRAGGEYWPLRTNLHLPDEVKKRTVARLKNNYTEFLGHRVRRTDRTDGLKLEFADGSWILLRLSGTEPLVRLYTEAATPEAASRLAEEASAWIFAAGTPGKKTASVRGRSQ